MIGGVGFVRFVLLLMFAATTVAAPTVCNSGSPPVLLGEPLGFCGSTGISCCDAVDDGALREQFGAMHIPDATCAAIVKSVLCARCLPFAWSSGATNVSVSNLCASSVQQQPTASRTQEQDTSMCLERISTATYHLMAAHPDGSARVFLSSRDGKVWLATMPTRGAGTLQINGDAFLDLKNHDGVRGIVGLAFHPKFTANGRFFVSYIGAGDGCRSRPCMVVAEFTAGGAGSDFSKATRASSEVKRIFTLGLPEPQQKLFPYQRHGGQILFDDSDGLYLITGYGYSSKQNGSSFLGKILRFNVGNGGSQWPDKKTHTDDKPEIFAAGLNNPSACSFDSGRFLCADVEQRSERVYLITASSSSSVATVSIVVNRGRPADGRLPSIVGGLVYRGAAEAWLKGRYLYVYSGGVWSGTSTTQLVANVSCSWSSPVPCRSSGGIGGRVLSMAKDNSRDAFFLSTAGVFRVVPSSACSALPQPPQWPPGIGWMLSVGATALALALYVCCAVQAGGGGGGGGLQIGGRCQSCCFVNSVLCCSGWYRCP